MHTSSHESLCGQARATAESSSGVGVALSCCEDPHHTAADGCDECATSWWTPRTAHLLHLVCEALVEEFLDCSGLRWAASPAELHLGWIAADLPAHLTGAMDRTHADALIGCLAELREKLWSGVAPDPAEGLTALAWHLVLTRAEERLELYGAEDEHATEPYGLPLHVDSHVQRSLPYSPADYDFITLRQRVGCADPHALGWR